MIRYLSFDEADVDRLFQVLNNPAVRKHLIEHPIFDRVTFAQWVEGKRDIDRLSGCRIRGVELDGKIVGWCGVQGGPTTEGVDLEINAPEGGVRYDIGIILEPSAWGVGPKIFRDMIDWAIELGHREIYIYLLDSRRAARPLLRYGFKEFGMITMLGRTFRAYVLRLNTAK
jgi:RimJ/RimL family protein N-acetyltransferase